MLLASEIVSVGGEGTPAHPLLGLRQLYVNIIIIIAIINYYVKSCKRNKY